ncbi:hypothetical protein HPP92_013273 [Vanilla planifolia]|uniref:Uncharacterized protein n=1 Tax=Vanilla planifolia TaxID=51239 RepID=A0A835UWK9_VANPL|nr:hypothetical protein HPP92_013749 [Vanilla planifolia]KAG0478554.1 hypothetical protein HPP92_013273 [Vanilla planifolia]
MSPSLQQMDGIWSPLMNGSNENKNADGEGGDELLESSDGGIIRHPRAFHAQRIDHWRGKEGPSSRSSGDRVGSSGLNSHLFFFRFSSRALPVEGGSPAKMRRAVHGARLRWGFKLPFFEQWRGDRGWPAQTAEAVGGCDIVSGRIGPFTRRGGSESGPKMPSPQGPGEAEARRPKAGHRTAQPGWKNESTLTVGSLKDLGSKVLKEFLGLCPYPPAA